MKTIVYGYVARIVHNSGEVFLQTTASNGDAARKMICKAECCPESSIREFYEVPRGLIGMPTKTIFEKYIRKPKSN
jgi:hypothetical protein